MLLDESLVENNVMLETKDLSIVMVLFGASV